MTPAPDVRVGFAALGTAPEELVALARHGRDVGFCRMVYGDHLLEPEALDSTAYPYAQSAPLPATGDYGDPLIVGTAVLAAVDEFEFLTGIYLLPMHHPLIVARAAITIQRISRGRLILGVGTGWMREEFEACGIDPRTRGKRFEEAMQIIRLACDGRPFGFDGEEFHFPPATLSRQPSTVPLVVGGASAVSLRRAAHFGDGWYSTPDMDVEECAAARDAIERLRHDARVGERPFTYYIRFPDLDPSGLSAFLDAGFNEFTLGRKELFPDLTIPVDAKRQRLSEIAEAFDLS